MNEKFRKLLENHGVDLTVGSIDYWQNEIEMALLEMCDEAAAVERQDCAEDYLKIMRDAVAREREACAKLCDARGELHGGLFGSWAQDISERIRARGNHEQD